MEALLGQMRTDPQTIRSRVLLCVLTTFLKSSKQYNNDQEEHKCKKQILILTIQEWTKTLGEFTNINRSLL